MTGDLDWRKSIHSNGEGGAGDCVLLAPLPEGGVALRHSRFPDREPFHFTPSEMRAFFRSVKEGEFDDLVDC